MAELAFEAQLVNAAEVRRLLSGLAPKLYRQALRPALRAGTKVVLTAVQKATPVGGRKWQTKQGREKRGGLLKKSLQIKAKKRSRKAIGYMVSTGRERFAQVGGHFKSVDVFYAPFVEFGHRIGKRTTGEHLGVNLRQRKGEKRGAYLDRIRPWQKRLAVINARRPLVPGVHFIERAGKAVADKAESAVVSTLKQRVTLLQARPLR